MRFYFPTWNPIRSEFEELPQLIEDIRSGKPARTTWSFASRKDGPYFGSAVLLLRQGKDSRGIVGVGRVVSKPFDRPHWDPTESPEKMQPRAVISFVDLVDPNFSPILESSKSRYAGANFWKAQGSGNECKDLDIAESLITEWEDHRTMTSGRAVWMDMDNDSYLQEALDEPFFVGYSGDRVPDYYIPATLGQSGQWIDDGVFEWVAAMGVSSEKIAKLQSARTKNIYLLIRHSVESPYEDYGRVDIERATDSTLALRCNSMQKRAGGFLEGDRASGTLSRLRRNEGARRACFDAHEAKCFACGMTFGAVYGLDRELLHVHHRNPLSRGKRETDPATDLVPLCPNCHVVVHSKENELLTPEALQQNLLARKRRT